MKFLNLFLSTLVCLQFTVSNAIAAEWRILDENGKVLFQDHFISFKYVGGGLYVFRQNFDSHVFVMSKGLSHSNNFEIAPGYEFEDIFVSKANYQTSFRCGEYAADTLLLVFRDVDDSVVPYSPRTKRVYNLCNMQAQVLLKRDYESIYRCDDSLFALGEHKTADNQRPCDFIFDLHDVSKAAKRYEPYDIAAQFAPVVLKTDSPIKDLDQYCLVQVTENDRIIAAKKEAHFNSTEWKDWQKWGVETPLGANDRESLLPLLKREHEIWWMSKGGIEELLGSPEWQPDADSWLYSLNRGDHLSGKWLEVDFNNEGKVVEWQVLNGSK